jgi:hemolysin activation/secretion protein
MVSGVRGEETGAASSGTSAAVSGTAEGETAAGGGEAEDRFLVREYRVQGAKELPRVEVEGAVYPFMGPRRTVADVEAARAALEKAYHEKGFQAVAVEVPPQRVKGGVVVLRVLENRVGRLRVVGSRYFDLNQIKRMAPSVAEGKVVDFNAVTRDMLRLNSWGDRRVTPSLRAGIEPGTVDVELAVKDSLPLHGSLELNNRYSPNTTRLRLNASLTYSNLWQLGHTVGFSYQVAPEKPDDSTVYSGFYIARVPGVDWLSFMLLGTKQDSDVSTLGSVGVAGRGETVGVRAIVNLPSSGGLYHSVSFGVDYKDFNQDVEFGTETTQTPVTYYPFDLTYTATWVAEGKQTALDAGVTFGARGMGSDEAEFDENRYRADAGFIYFHGALSHERELAGGFEGFAKVHGQIANKPLLNTEQFGGGGLGTVRGYLEAETLGDNAVAGTVEVRSPSLLGFLGKEAYEWRLRAFGDAAWLTVRDPLPEQESSFRLASVGVGSEMKLFQYTYGSIDAAWPLISLNPTRAHEVHFTFRVWAEF